MIVLRTTASSQTISVIPRFEPFEQLRYTLRSEDENKQVYQFTTSMGTPYSYTNGYLNTSYAFNSPRLVEGQFYQLTVEEKDGGDWNLLYRGKIFVTDQTELDKYTTQQGDFEQYENNDNEFIIV